MKLLILTYILAVLLSAPVLAQVGPECAPPITRENFTALVYDVKAAFFPELNDIRLGVETFSSNAYFLQAQPVAVSLFGRKKNRRYNVQLNLKLLECPPSLNALEAILVHELEHIVDYLPMSTGRVASHGLQYLLNKKFKRSYERSTDCKVLDRGLHHGLSEYRKWVYQWLTPKELLTKRRLYLTPEEIEVFENSGKCSINSSI